MKIHWSKVAHLAAEFAPLLLADTPLAPLASFISHGIATAQQAVEADGKMTNKQAQDLAVKEVHNAVEAVNAQDLREIINTDTADKALRTAIDAVVAGINLKTDIMGSLTEKGEGSTDGKTAKTKAKS